MVKTVFIASTEAHSGKSIVSIGLVNMLLGKAQRIGYYKPVISQNLLVKKDEHIDAILTHFDLPMSYDDTFALTWQVNNLFVKNHLTSIAPWRKYRCTTTRASFLTSIFPVAVVLNY